MRNLLRATLLGLCATGAMGVSHCERGDDLAFEGNVCFARFDADGGVRGPAPLPIVTARFTRGGLWVPTEITVEVTACGASLTRIREGEAVERLGPSRFVAPNEMRALHDALAEAGAGDVVGYADCAMTTGHDSTTEITFYEPSLVPGRAWSNRFGFGNCSLDPRAGEAAVVLWSWLTERFGPDLF